MTPREIFALYAQERRHEQVERLRLELLPYFSRYTPESPGEQGFIAFNRIPPDQVACQIEEQIRYFSERGCWFEWKVYDFDEPPNLRELLEERGFRAQHPEAFLVFPLDASCPPEGRPAPGIRLVKADSPQVVHDAAAVQEAVWKEEVAGLAPALIRRLQERPDQFSLYVAYAREKPVGTGWTDLAPHSHFADLRGGAVLPEWRGQGIYSMLLHQRCREAQERGYRYLAVDAAPMSRPILEKKGFQFICFTYPLDSRG